MQYLLPTSCVMIMVTNEGEDHDLDPFPLVSGKHLAHVAHVSFLSLCHVHRNSNSMARTKNNVRSFAPWTSQGLARVVGRSNNEPAKERSTLITPEKQPLGPATATPDHAIQPPLPSLAPPLESDRSSRLSRTQPYNPAIRHAPLEELTPRNLYNNFPSPAGPATPVVPPPPSPPSQPHPAVAAVTKGVQGRDEPGLRSGCARLEQADGAGPSQPAAGSGVAAAAEARPEPSQPAAASPQQARARVTL
ncbi:hypothetical protein HaLaN_12450 [Haematococcus lacustris]|uniref:Uncharacterized protein n=1 Tax=Haematococcus lacustris TaxID=44745 RepID=A0A699Z0R2_HAELA|nr:hypothetical protein HaLaN_12450 [Haematococcus lacustris]